MRPVKDPNFTEEHHRDTTSLALGNLATKSCKECLDIRPKDVPARRVGVNRLKDSPMLPFHHEMVLHKSTTSQRYANDG